jgi:putative DNA methylase
MTHTTKKLIEVALPLDAINIASAREKSIRHGHPSTLHLWWAQRPLAATRAVIMCWRLWSFWAIMGAGFVICVAPSSVNRTSG